MSTRATQLYSQQTNGVTFADPLEPDFTVRFKTTSSPKSLNGMSVTNYATEIIINDQNRVDIGQESAVDALSIRIRVSGSNMSQSRLQDMLVGLSAQLPVWVGENVLIGFQPTTVPTNTIQP